MHSTEGTRVLRFERTATSPQRPGEGRPLHGGDLSVSETGGCQSDSRPQARRSVMMVGRLCRFLQLAVHLVEQLLGFRRVPA